MFTRVTNRFQSGIGVAALILTISLSGVAQGQASGPQEHQAPATMNTNTTADFYVATNGNDTWPGTLAQPFLTVDRARVAVQALKPTVSGRAITVLIRAGVYALPATWAFTAADSGTAITPIVYANYPGETPVISGGQTLTGWAKNSSGNWQLTLPSGEYFTQLWVNGSRRYRPRTTPGGYLYIAGEYSTTGSKTTVNELSYTTHAVGGVPTTMANLPDVELIDFEAWDVPHMRIASVDTTNQRIVTTASLTVDSSFSGFVPGHRFLLENVKEAFVKPGEFYLDRPTGVLIYIPQSGESLATATVVAPHLQKILTAQNLSNVTFQGLTFAYSDWQVPAGGYLSGQAENGIPASLTLTNSTGVVFEGDTVEHTGGYGIEFLGAGTPGGASPYVAQFQDGLISDTGAGGIRVGGIGVCSGAGAHTDQNVPQHIYIGNNLITGGGRVGIVGVAVDVGDAHDVLVEHNEISDFYSTGVSVGFNWGYACNFAHDDVVQFNLIHDLGQGITNDMGAVYYLSGINTGNKILNNTVYNIEQDPDGGYGGWGLYADQGALGIQISNNLVYRTTDASLHVNAAVGTPPVSVPPIIFNNNILAYGAMGVMDRHNDTSFLSIVFQNNIFYYDTPAIQYGYWYCEGNSNCTNYFDFNNNLYFNEVLPGGEPAQPFFKTGYFPLNGGQQPPTTALTFAQWQAQGEDTQSIFADPVFTNPTPGIDNFTLGLNSPAYGVGFVPFDPAQAGRLPSTTVTAPVNAPAFPLLTRAITAF